VLKRLIEGTAIVENKLVGSQSVWIEGVALIYHYTQPLNLMAVIIADQHSILGHYAISSAPSVKYGNSALTKKKCACLKNVNSMTGTRTTGLV